MAETVKFKGRGAKGFPGQLGEVRVKRLHLAGFRSCGKGRMKRPMERADLGAVLPPGSLCSGHNRPGPGQAMEDADKARFLSERYRIMLRPSWR